MNVQQVGNHHAFGQISASRGPGEQTDALKSASVRTISPEESQSGDSSSDSAQGVLRLLEDGHFKGVADVRLRINFYAELQQESVKGQAAAVGSGADALTNGIDNAVQSFASSLSEDDLKKLVSDFKDAVGKIAANTAGGDTSPAKALSQFHAAFADLVGNLQDAFNTPLLPDITADGSSGADSGDSSIDAMEVSMMVEIDMPAAETSPDSEAGSETDAGFASALDSLQKWFDDQMSQMTEDVNSVQTAGTLSSPSGNGRAYAKFLEIYNSMGAAPAAPLSGPVDGTAELSLSV